MEHTKFTCYIILSLLFMSCKHSHAQDEYTNQELKTFITDYYSVMSQRNWDAYKAFFAEKAILTTIWQGQNDTIPGLLTNTITEFLAQTENGPDSQPIFEERPIKINIAREKNLASAWVYYEAKFGTSDNLIRWKGYDLFSLLKFNNKWHIVSITYISDE